MDIKSSKTVFECPIFKVEERELTTYSGADRKFWVVVRAPHVAVIGLTKDKKFVLTKEIVGKDDQEIITIPGGKVEIYNARKEEIKRQAAAEFHEEAGYQAEKMELFLEDTPPSNWYERTFYKYAAWDLTEVGQKLSGGESIKPYLVSLEELNKLIQENKLTFPHEKEALLKSIKFFKSKGLL